MSSRATPLPRVAIVGIAIESSTFSPHRAGLADFVVRRGTELLDYYPFLTPGQPLRERAEWVPLMQARSIPGGAVRAETYQQLERATLDLLAAHGPFDGVFFDIHGAMSVEAQTDAEGGLATRVREVVGPTAMVSASMDLHGNVTRQLLDAVDLITCYRMAPHEDAMESRERSVRNLLDRLDSGRRPHQAWVPVPVLLPGEKTSTRVEPASRIYAEVPKVEALDGVLDAAIWVGYAWADEPRCRAAVVVTGDDPELASQQAERLARAYWQARAEFSFVAPAGTLDECLAEALASPARPFVLSDSGDNPTAGGAADVTWTLARLLAHPAFATGELTGVYAAIPDAAGARAAAAAGVAADVSITVGARVDDRHQGPVTLTGTVAHVSTTDPVAGTVAVVAVGGLRVIVTERRKPYHTAEDFSHTGIDPAQADIVVVKIGYLEPYLYELAADWRLLLTPGGVDQDLLRLGHNDIQRPMFPFDPDMPDPDLTAVVVPPRDRRTPGLVPSQER
ncbi:M81 family metallopeptidase [Natronosporangium hydrolyticum]|uniref:M81 family metallopeptidase n=1 Tax=Natronosporangium hydrolyticum TaxID=2811111 RepID=A0A895YFI9_9ACTN|nr:M81 family metallopeptidase [Natronosporangium hydrolyticum]QSB16634.1 M81 family metallopeptidase [Natronosporangium hydrolyticum]